MEMLIIIPLVNNNILQMVNVIMQAPRGASVSYTHLDVYKRQVYVCTNLPHPFSIHIYNHLLTSLFFSSLSSSSLLLLNYPSKRRRKRQIEKKGRKNIPLFYARSLFIRSGSRKGCFFRRGLRVSTGRGRGVAFSASARR